MYFSVKKSTNCVDETQYDMLGLQPKQFNLYQSAVHTELKCGSNFIISYFLNGKKNTFYSREIHVKLHLRFQFSHEKLSMKDYFQLLLKLGLAMYVYPHN